MFVPPDAGRNHPSLHATIATSKRGKNRPRPLPRATIPIPQWDGNFGFYSLPDAKAIISHTDLKLTRGATPDALAKSLSAAAYRFFYGLRSNRPCRFAPTGSIP